MKTIDVDATIDNLTKVLEFIDVNLEEINCDMKDQIGIDVSVEELYVNIAHYAYPDGVGTATISYDFTEDTRTVKIILKDSGIPFDPLAKEDPDITLSAQEREIGGLGIFMVKKNMDEFLYEYTDGCNITTITKKL